MRILITGRPGTGKTTLVRRLVEKLPDAVGFYTEEIREGGVRKGFRLKSLSGEEGVLSHVNIRSPHRVGKYRVDMEEFEAFLEGIDFSSARVVVIDEIGKMECLSPRFRELIKELLSSQKTLIATIALKGTPFIEGLKGSCGAEVLEVTEGNRDALVNEIAGRLAREGKRN